MMDARDLTKKLQESLIDWFILKTEEKDTHEQVQKFIDLSRKAAPTLENDLYKADAKHWYQFWRRG